MKLQLLLLAALASLTTGALAQAPEPAPERRAEIVRLVRQDCGSCHGMTFNGGLGPSLRPEALRGKPVESLKATVLMGRPGTPMPPWQRFLNEAEAEWVIERLLEGFPTGS